MGRAWLHLEHTMKRPADKSRSIPVHDYRLALQSAVSWLGDRYLLAEPVARRREEPAPFFSEPRRWHEAPRAAARRRH
jgi:hypothetical protein